MQVSSRFTIAVHMFSCIEHFSKDYKITSDFIAGSVNANPVVIRKIMSMLRDAGLVNVARGTGGITLARDAKDITFLDIFNAVESLDDGRLFHFHENPNANCPVGRNIHLIVDDKLDRIQAAMEKELESITVADINKDTRKYAK